MSRSSAPDPKAEMILSAASRQFRAYGFRRTSMEDIARGADISRPALYLHFTNKEEIFVRVAEKLHDEAVAMAENALTGAADVEAGVRGALGVKVSHFLDVMGSSAHGAELFDESSRLCAELSARTETRMQKMLATAFRDAVRSGELDLGSAGLTAESAAELIRLAAYGLKHPSHDAETFRRRLKALTAVFFAGLRRH